MNNINYKNYDNISDKSDNNNNNKSFKIDDIRKIWKKDFIDLSSFESAYNLFYWKDNPNKDIKLLGKLFNFFIFECNKIILIGFYNSIPKSWYKIKSINDLHIFIDYYQNNEIKPNEIKPNEIKLYLTSKFDFKQLIKYFYFQEFIDKTIFSENCNIQVKNITLYDEILLLDKFLGTITEKSTVTFTTKYSKSNFILRCAKNGYYIQILFNPIRLINRFKILSKDMPSDIDIILLNLNILRTEDITENIESIEENEIDILFDIAPNDKLKIIMSEIIELKPELKLYITKKISLIDMNLTFDKMKKDGLFKAFENSLDILLKTIYDKFNDSEYDQSENMLDLNKKIKNIITNIFDSKII